MMILEKKKSVATKRKMYTLPQANDFNKIIELVKAFINKKYHTHESLQSMLKVHDREISYYLHASRNFNLVRLESTDGNIHYYSLTDSTKNALEKSEKSQIFYFMRRIMSNDLCKFVVDTYIEEGKYPTYEKVKSYIKVTHPELHNLSDITLMRRLSTINSWSKWVIQNLKNIF